MKDYLVGSDRRASYLRLFLFTIEKMCSLTRLRVHDKIILKSALRDFAHTQVCARLTNKHVCLANFWMTFLLLVWLISFICTEWTKS